MYTCVFALDLLESWSSTTARLGRYLIGNGIAVTECVILPGSRPTRIWLRAQLVAKSGKQLFAWEAANYAARYWIAI